MAYLIYIATALAIGLLIGLVTLSIMWLRQTVLHNIRSKTVGLMSVYDELLEEKSLKLKMLEAAEAVIDDKKKEEQQVVVQPVKAPSKELTGGNEVLNMVERASTAAYRDSSVGDIYRMIRENFSYRPEELAAALANSANGVQGAATKLLESLEWDTVYQLSTLPDADQLSVLESVVDNAGKHLLVDYVKLNNSFNVLDFYEYLKAVADTEPKPISLRVSPEFSEHCSYYEGVDIIPDDEICEGFQVEENHLLYDYCIKARELR